MLELDDEIAGGDHHRPEIQAEANLERETVRRALHLLTAEQRQVITLKFLEGWENHEIAAAVQKPIGAVKALQHRALSSLRRLLLPEEKEQAYEPD